MNLLSVFKDVLAFASSFLEADPQDKSVDPSDINARIEGLRGDQQKTFWKLYSDSQSRLSATERQNKADLVAMFRQATQNILDDVNQVFSKVQGNNWDYGSLRRMGRDKALFEQIRNRLEALGADINDTVTQSLVAAFKQSYTENAYALDTLTPPGTAIRFGLVPDEAIVAMLNEPFQGARFSDRLGHITDEMADRIKHELIRSMIAQESWSSAASRIRDEMGAGKRAAFWRANMVARTELTRARELGAAAFNEANSDLISKVVWMAHPGACDICIMLNGSVLETPDDYPPEASHPNCGCSSRAVPKPWQELADEREKDAPLEKVGFETWAEDRGVAALSTL